MAAQRTMEGRREGQHNGPWMAGVRGWGMDSDNGRQGEGQGQGQHADHSGQEAGALVSQQTMQGRKEW